MKWMKKNRYDNSNPANLSKWWNRWQNCCTILRTGRICSWATAGSRLRRFDSSLCKNVCKRATECTNPTKNRMRRRLGICTRKWEAIPFCLLNNKQGSIVTRFNKINLCFEKWWELGADETNQAIVNWTTILLTSVNVHSESPQSIFKDICLCVVTMWI